jgi:hypothetical protein
MTPVVPAEALSAERSVILKIFRPGCKKEVKAFTKKFSG